MLTNSIDHINAIKSFINAKAYTLVDEISFGEYDFNIPIKFQVSPFNTVEKLYKTFDEAGFHIRGIEIHKKLPGTFKTPYAIIRVSQRSTFFERLLVGYSEIETCYIENGTLKGCYELRDNLENDCNSKHWLRGIRVETDDDFKFKCIKLNYTQLSFCPFCGKSLSMEEENDE